MQRFETKVKNEDGTNIIDDNMLKDSVSDEDQDAIEEMMERIEDNTCLRFRWIIMKKIVRIVYQCNGEDNDIII